MPRNKKDRPEEIENLGSRIKQIRKELGYKSAETFAYEKGISRSEYSKFEAGRDMRFSSIVKVCNALDVAIDVVF